MASKVNLTIRAGLYLRCINDWKAPFEVAAILAEIDLPRRSPMMVRKYLLSLVDRGLADHHDGNDTFRISDAGRALLSSGKTGE